MARINRQSRAPVRVKELTPAEADKEEGNALFKAAKYQEVGCRQQGLRVTGPAATARRRACVIS